MYCWDPNLYSSNSSAQKNWGLELLAKLHFKGNERVLDVGCGDGKLSAEIARNLPDGSVLGIDLSEEMITFARNHYPTEKFPNLAFMQTDARKLTFDSEFDIVFSNAVLHWIKAPERYRKLALKDFGKASNPAEYCWLSLEEGETLQKFLKSLTQCLRMKNGTLISGTLYFHMVLTDLKNTVNGSKIQVFQ